MAAGSVDLVFGSPPYENARTYNMGFNLTGQDWVDWMVSVCKESLRVCKGLVAFVVEGRTKDYQYSATPFLLAADLHRAGICLRKPPVFYRFGITGSGNVDWLRNDWEPIICMTNGGRLPWSDNTAMGKPCKHEVGGEMSYRNEDGKRKNKRHRNNTPSQSQRENGAKGNPGYKPPKIANPGNVIRCNVGGGHLGDKLAHENEAPFPESLAEFFIKSFCPEGGIVLDPFSGSGTTGAVACKFGRNAVLIDIRECQVKLAEKRIKNVKGLFG
jgi:site-specific DNA-methyltransferase (cytosine-N4-specific)